MKPTRLIRLRVPRLAVRSWLQLVAAIEKQLSGERLIPRQLFMSRSDFEALRAACFASDDEWAREFFASRMGRFRRAPYVAPLLPGGTALYESAREDTAA